MKLRELGAEFIKRTGEKTSCYVEALGAADGIMFLCPKCFAANKGSVGTHSVLCWFAGKVGPEVDPKPGRWVPGGTSIDDLTFVGPASSSVRLTSGCNWHGLIQNGEAVDA